MYLAWAFIFLLVLVIIIALLLRAKLEMASETGPRPKQAKAYAAAQPVAENVKAIIQMIVGTLTVSAVGWRLLYAPGHDPVQLVLNGIGVGLAVASAFELAYTLFTPGPDEALDPLMLAISATILLKLGQLGNAISLADAGAFLLLGALLVVLFATRLMLAERGEEERPNIWWIPYRRGEASKDHRTK